MFNFKKPGPKVLLSFTNTRKSNSCYSFGKTKKKKDNLSFKLFDSIPVNRGILWGKKKEKNPPPWGKCILVTCEKSFEAATSLTKITLLTDYILLSRTNSVSFM